MLRVLHIFWMPFLFFSFSFFPDSEHSCTRAAPWLWGRDRRERIFCRLQCGARGRAPSRDPEIVKSELKSRVGRPTDWATQVPQMTFLYQICILQDIFSLSVAYLLIFSTKSWRADVFNFSEAQLINFVALWFVPFTSYLEVICITQGHKEVFPVCSLGSFIILGCTLS